MSKHVRPIRARNLLAGWTEITARLRKAKHVALFLDFDGTLVRLRPRPEQVRLDLAGRRLLRRLARDARFSVWIISGRRWLDLKRRIGVRELGYLGLHGWDYGQGNGWSPETVAVLQEVRDSLTELSRQIPGVRLEFKGLIPVLHYRKAAGSTARKLGDSLRRALRPISRHMRLLPGIFSWEALPREVKGKGFAVRTLLAKLPPSTLAIYVGDDMADEAAFRALHRGLTIHVGKRNPTAARYRLRNPKEVREFLRRLEEEKP